MDKSEILDLLIRKHYGLISDEEDAQLEQILATDNEAREMQLDVQARRPKDKALDLVNRVDLADAELQINVKHQAVRNRRRIVRMRWISAAAIIGIITTIGIFNFPRKQQLAVVDPNALTLQLANGQTIQLKDSGQQSITSGNTLLNNNNRVLRFNTEGADVNSWNTLTVPAKLDYKVELSDGTTVWLNSTTQMRFPFAFGESREVYIEGEAYFKVAADANKPFIVHIGKTAVNVLGTEFNLNSYTKGIVVTSLVQGKIAVTVDNKRIELKPGKEVVTSGDNMTVADFDNKITLGWRQGVHYFQDANMLEIADMIKRYFDITMVMDEPAAGQQHFRGKMLRYQPLEMFVDQLNTLGDVKIYWKDGKLHCSLAR